MNRRCLVRGFVLAIVAVGTVPTQADDALPAGATRRLGTTVLRNLNVAPIGMLPPKYDSFVIRDPAGVGFRLVDPATGAIRTDLIGSRETAEGEFNQVSTDGKIALSRSYNGLSVWDVANGDKLIDQQVERIPYGNYSVDLSGNGKFVAYGSAADDDDRKAGKFPTVTVYDIANRKSVAKLTVIQNATSKVALSPTGNYAITWGEHVQPNQPNDEDRTKNPRNFAQFWSLPEGKELGRVLLPNNYGDPKVVFSPTSDIAAIYHSQPTIGLYDLKTAKLVRTLYGPNGLGSVIAFSPDGSKLAVVAGNQQVVRWETDSGKYLDQFPAPIPSPGYIGGIGYSAEDRIVVWGIKDSCRVAWEAISGTLLSAPFAGHTRSVAGIAFGNDGTITSISTASYRNHGVYRWSPDGFLITPYGLDLRYTDGLNSISSDASRLFGEMAVVSAEGDELFRLMGPPNYSGHLRPTASGKFGVSVCTTYSDKVTTVPIIGWDLVNAIKLGEVEVPKTGYNQPIAAISPTGKSLAALVAIPKKENENEDKGPSHKLITWELPSGKKLAEHDYKREGYNNGDHLLFVDDNEAILYIGTKLNVIDVKTAKPSRAIELGKMQFGGTYAATCAPELNPDGSILAFPTTSQNRGRQQQTVFLFDYKTGKPLKQFVGHNQQITCVQFSPDGKTLATGSGDTTILLWDLAAKGQPLTITKSAEEDE